MYFIKLGERYINLDNVTRIEHVRSGGSYYVHFVGQSTVAEICENDMADIRRELEKVKMLQDLDKIVLKTDEEAKAEKETECVGCEWNKRDADGTWVCTGHHACSVKLGLKLLVHKK